MAVQEQTPLQEYTANGITKQFDLEFDCESAEHLIVSIDDQEVLHTDWYLSGNAIVFHVAPASGKQVKIQRNTPFNRLADYQSYNNSFRPPAINKDFDRIWWKLQELGVADWILGNRINALKNYVDRKDDELKSYLMEEIRKQGVALDQLDEYYNYLMERLAQIAVDKGWDASFVVDASGKSQQEINNNVESEILSRLPISRFCDVTGVEPSDDGLVEALVYSALHGITLEITGKIRITKTVIQPAGSSVDCVNGIVFCENPVGLTNSEMWVVKDDVTVFKTTRIGTLILSTGSDISSFVDRDVVGLKVTSPKITVTNLYTYGCRLGGLITDAPAYETDIKFASCMINSWTDKTKWGINLNAQDGTSGTLVTLGYAKGVRVGGTNYVKYLHPWGLPATNNPLEYPNKQLLTGVALSTNAHVTHAYLDTIDTESFDAPQTGDDGVAIVFEGANARIDKAFVLVHSQTKAGKVKLVSYYGAQNTITELTVGDSSRLDTTTPVKYSVPVQKWQNHVLGGNVLFLTNRFIYPADDLINGGVFNGIVEFRRVGYNEIIVDANIGYISGAISDSSFGINMPDSLSVLSLAGEVTKRTMLKPLAGAVSKIVFNNPRISPAKFIEETGIIALYTPSDIWGGELNFTARFINASAAY